MEDLGPLHSEIAVKATYILTIVGAITFLVVLLGARWLKTLPAVEQVGPVLAQAAGDAAGAQLQPGSPIVTCRVW
jgi:hypothetical protein